MPALRQELLDNPSLPLDQTEQALGDLERANRWLFGIGASIRTLLPRIRRGSSRQTLVDLGTGTGQVIRILRRRARHRGIDLRLVGVDRKLSHLLAGRARGSQHPVVVATASCLPFRSNSFDWVFSNLLFHHFSGSENSQIIAEMDRVARQALVVVDLRRSKIGSLLVRLLLPMLRLSPVAIYDGKISVDQAWNLDDVRTLVGPRPFSELTTRFPVRFSLVVDSNPDT
jgi:SAM-dependent methyltransferase